QANTAYAYRVRAFNASGTSAYTTEAAVITPAAASALSVSTANLPDALVDVAYDRTLTASGGRADYIWTPDNGRPPPRPTPSPTGRLSGTPTAAGTSNFVVKVTDSNSSTATKALSLIVRPAAPLTITTTQLPRGSVGTTYSQNLGASGGQTPYNWTK